MSKHQCKYCVIHCMDFRIQETVDKLIKSLGIKNGEFDRVSVPGGAGNFGQLLEDLRLSNRLHNASDLILTVHEDCGAGATRDDLIEAMQDMKTLFPSLTVRGFFVMLNGTWEEM